MCIFSESLTVNSTKILAGVLPNGNKILAYANNVSSPTTSIMMLPIPTTGSIKFYDTTKYSDFLENLAQKIHDDEYGQSRSSSKGFEVVGKYQMATIAPQDVIATLIQHKQPVYSWLYDLLDWYNGWSWLFVIIPAGEELNGQPLLIEYTQQFNPDKLYFPMMDVHGNEPLQSQSVHRNHVLCVADSTTPDPINIDFPPHYPFKDLKHSGLNINGFTENGDIFGDLQSDYNWQLDFQFIKNK